MCSLQTKTVNLARTKHVVVVGFSVWEILGARFFNCYFIYRLLLLLAIPMVFDQARGCLLVVMERRLLRRTGSVTLDLF